MMIQSCWGKHQQAHVQTCKAYSGTVLALYSKFNSDMSLLKNLVTKQQTMETV